MTYERISHVAIRVPDLREAEQLYTTLFETDIAFRETTVDGEWHTLAANTDWNDATATGITPQMSFIVRDELFLALEQTDTDRASADELWYHIGLTMTREELDSLREQVEALSCTLLSDQQQSLLVEDPYGYQWDVATTWEPKSTGERTGRWLEV